MRALMPQTGEITNAQSFLYRGGTWCGNHDGRVVLWIEDFRNAGLVGGRKCSAKRKPGHKR
jgi:hypothetical protein